MDKWELPGHRSDENCSVLIPLHSPGFWNIEDFVCPVSSLRFCQAGILLGQTCLSKLFPGFANTLFPAKGAVFLEITARMGYVFFMFLIGVKMDPSVVFKSGKNAWTIGLVSVLIPFASSMIMMYELDNLLPLYRRPAIRSIIAVQFLTPFPVIASFLMDLKIINSELGRLALSSALISDLISNVASTVSSNMRLAFEGGMAFPIGVQSFALTMSLVLFIVFVIRPGFIWIVKQTPEGKPVKSGYVVMIAGLVLMFAIISDNIGLQYHFGPFIIGLTVPVGPPLGSTLVEKLETLVSGLFAPLLLTVCGMKVDLFTVYDTRFLAFVWLVIIASAVVKTATTFIPALMCKVPLRDAFALAAMMNTQGIVEIASYLKNYVNQTIDNETFSTVIASVIFTTVTTTIVERSLYDYSRTYTGYQKRTIIDTPRGTELRILVCSSRQDDILATLKLLEAVNPTKEYPVGAYGLNLVELLGRAAPLLINHGLGQKGSTSSKSQNIIDVYKYYERRYAGAVSIQIFTAVSPPKFMHVDICSLAFDKSSSFIVLPFHRKWNHQGQKVYDSSVVRSINRQVLELAPCSVGVLIDRRRIIRSTTSVNRRVSSYRVAMLFLGGDDDREALALVKRMARSPEVHLTVVRLVPEDNVEETPWEYILNAENLKELKMRSREEGTNVSYKEEVVRDGSDTASVVSSMQEVFDLVVVGRRHKEGSPMLTGLSEWMELPELGPLGDILGVSDIDKSASVLVVQQQLMQA